MRATDISISGKSRVLYPGRIARQSAVYWTASRESSMTTATTQTLITDRLWHILTTLRADCAHGGIPRVECYGSRLPADYNGDIPDNMLIADIPEAEYAVFEHGPFDYEQECRSVEDKVEKAMSSFDYAAAGYELDLTPGRIAYFYFDPDRCFKYVRPVKRIK